MTPVDLSKACLVCQKEYQVGHMVQVGTAGRWLHLGCLSPEARDIIKGHRSDAQI